MQFQVEPHPEFKRRGANIISKLRLKLTEALLGCQKHVRTAWGQRPVTVPPGTSGGDTLSLPGEGVPRLDGSGRGHHVLEIEVASPKTLTDEQIALIARLRESGL